MYEKPIREPCRVEFPLYAKGPRVSVTDEGAAVTQPAALCEGRSRRGCRRWLPHSGRGQRAETPSGIAQLSPLSRLPRPPREEQTPPRAVSVTLLCRAAGAGAGEEGAGAGGGPPGRGLLHSSSRRRSSAGGAAGQDPQPRASSGRGASQRSL